MTALIPTEAAPLAPRDEATQAFLDSQAPSTRAAYQKSIRFFAAHLGAPDVADAARTLLSGRAGEANRTVLGWRNALRDAGLKPATVNSRIAAVRSLVKFARMLGIVEFTLDVPSLKATKPTRRGPGEDDYAKLVGACATPRERALVLLLGDRGLRRGEIASLRLEDWRDEGTHGVLSPLRKGLTERVDVTIHGATLAAVRSWLEERPAGGGSLFVTPSGSSESGDTIFDVFRHLAGRTGVVTSPHRLRRRAITMALDVTNGDVRSVKDFAGHSAVATTIGYDDKAGQLAERVARAVAGEGL